MKALKWGIVAISSLTGILVGTYELIGYGSSTTKSSEFVGLEQVSSYGLSEQITPTETFETTKEVSSSSLAISQASSILSPVTEVSMSPTTQTAFVSEEVTEISRGGQSETSSNAIEQERSLKEDPKKELSEPIVSIPEHLVNPQWIAATPPPIVEQIVTNESSPNPESSTSTTLKATGSVTIPTTDESVSSVQENSSETLQTSDLTDEVAPRQLTREEIKANADAIFEKLDDYTFKLFSNCNSGTGWILDYQIPDQKDKYPLIWYIATNAHVIRQWHFDHTNPYRQILPTKLSPYRQKWQDYYTDYSSKHYSLYSTNSCYYKNNYGAFDLNISKQSDGQALRSDRGAISQNKIKKPKLFWTALNIFDKDVSAGIKGNNFKDFAVIEIEFKDEQTAREMTRDFAKKYTVESKNALNIFGKPISKERLTDDSESFYSLGYPTKERDRFGYSKAFNPDTLEGEKIVKDPWRRDTIAHDKKLIGHVATQSFRDVEIEWGGKKYSRMGHFYFLKGFPLGKGASGSMSVDKEGNLIGLKTKGEVGEGAKYSMITPIRSEAIEVEGDFKTLKYDLILGVDGQKSSYREQIQKFGKTTWLSSMGWRHHSENSQIN